MNEPNHEEIRFILEARGAPAKDIEWLVASCPSSEYALTYEPPAELAWCIRCRTRRYTGTVHGCRECGCKLGVKAEVRK